jgi:bacterioferritin-associated ferredoxin
MQTIIILIHKIKGGMRPRSWSDMYVCLCKAVTDGQIRQAVCAGACTMRELRACLGVATECGRCGSHASRLLAETLNNPQSERQDQAA